MRIKYLGPSPARTLADGRTVARDETVEVDDDYGKRLCLSPKSWEEQKGGTKPKKTKE